LQQVRQRGRVKADDVRQYPHGRSRMPDQVRRIPEQRRGQRSIDVEEGDRHVVAGQAGEVGFLVEFSVAEGSPGHGISA